MLPLAKFWDVVLSDNVIASSSSCDFFDANNYAFRFEHLFNSAGNVKLKQFVYQNTLLNGYLSSKAKPVQIQSHNKRSLSKQQQPEQLVIYNDDKKEQESIKSLPPEEQQQDEEELLLKDKTSVKQVLLDVLNRPLDAIQAFCKSSLLPLVLSSEQDTFVMLIECFVDEFCVNTSCSASRAFLTCLVAEYVLFYLRLKKHANSIEECDNLHTPSMLRLYSSLLTSGALSRLYIECCLVPWLLQLSVNAEAASVEFVNSVKTSVELMLEKPARELFGEADALFMVQILCEATTPQQQQWTELVYGVVAILLEKAPPLAAELLETLLGQMKRDSKHLAKSGLFARLLSSIISKYRYLFAGGASTSNLNSDNNNDLFDDDDDDDDDEEEFIIGGEEQHQQQLITATSGNKVLSLIRAIIDSNQTMLKNSLLEQVKNYK